MKKQYRILIFIIFVLGISMVISSYNSSNRYYKYEAYCDSIYENNPDYYYDVIMETDSFQNYILKHGEW